MAGRGGVVRPKLLGRDLFKDLEKRVDQMVTDIDATRVSAAAKATARSRSTFDGGRSGRPYIPARPRRPTTKGTFSKNIEWEPTRDAKGNGTVSVNIEAMEKAYPGPVKIWLINEIGTGASAFIERPDADASTQARRIKVKSQVGRIIPYGLTWGTKAGGKWVPPGGGTNQQLHPALNLSGVPSPRAQIRISEEIKPKHYLRDGGTEGFRQFEQSALAAAYAAFAGHPRR